MIASRRPVIASTEISAEDLLARERAGPAFERDAPFLEAVDAIGSPHRLYDVLLDQDDAGALGLDSRQRRVDVGDDDRRKPEADLVTEKNPGIGHQGATDRGHLLLATGQDRR